MSETVLLLNNQVEKVLLDNPTREEVLNQLDKINELWRMQIKISFFICSEAEYQRFLNLVTLIKDNVFRSNYLTFYYELPVHLYDWLKTYTFNEIIDQISMYLAYDYLYMKLNGKDISFYKKNLFPIIWNKLEKNIRNIEQTELSKTDIVSHKLKYKKHRLSFKDKKLNECTLKYWTVFQKKYNTNPIEPFEYITNPNSKKIISPTNNLDFNVLGYVAKDSYRTILDNPLSGAPDNLEFGYTDDYLDLWKYHYKYNIGTAGKINDKVLVVSSSAINTNNDVFTCASEGCHTELKFEKKYFKNIKENHQYLCDFCFIKKYFDAKI